MSYPATIAHAIQQSQEWLKQVRDYADLADEQNAYSVLRAVLHQLRDRLTLDEAFGLAAQLPLIIRGIYFEGYRPRDVPERIRSKQRFLDGVAAKLRPHRIAPEAAVRAVFATLAHRCDPGEIADVIDQLPGELKALWPKGRASELSIDQ
ncbi:MAG: DUF2267 domain-containing protein [Rhodospirillales bacterium]|nr:DUF2267 domain-containing protein [Rhodospirillales bacterium]